jgi:hypothetical protein
MDERVQILERRLGVGGDLLDQLAGRPVLVPNDLLREGELHPQDHEPLLRTAVQVAGCTRRLARAHDRGAAEAIPRRVRTGPILPG